MERIPGNWIALAAGLLLPLLLWLYWFRVQAGPPLAFGLDALISLTITGIEVFFLGLFLSWFLNRHQSRRLAGNRQVVLNLIFHILYGGVFKPLKSCQSPEEAKSALEKGEAEAVQQSRLFLPLNPGGTAKLQSSAEEKERLAWSMAFESAGEAARRLDRAMIRIEALADRLAELFEPGFVSELLLLIQAVYEFADAYGTGRQTQEMLSRIAKVAAQSGSDVMKDVYKTVFEGLGQMASLLPLTELQEKRDRLQEQCRRFVGESIYPLAASDLQKKIRAEFRSPK